MIESRRKRFVALALALMAAALLVLPGCVFSETITERIIDSDPESIIDYELEPILINTATASETTDKLPKLDEGQTDQQQDQKDDFSELTDEQNDSNAEAPNPQYNENATSTGLATTTSTGSTENSNNTSTDAGDADDGGWSDVDEGDDDESEEDEDDSESDDDGPSGDNGGSGRKSGGSGDYYSDAPDMDDPEIPEGIDEVVAFGNNAVIVSILTGSESGSALIGCDSATQQATATVLASRGVGAAQAIDCTEGETMSASAFKVLANNIVPDMVYVTEGKNPFSTDQMAALAKKNISVYTLPALTSDARIRFAFQVVAQTLETGGVSGALAKYEEYRAFCDGVVDAYSQANGGLTGGFDFDEAAEVDTGAADVVTLLIDHWDSGARYTNGKAGGLDSSGGAAVATLGYESSPVNYFLSAGGVLNNAGSKKVRKVTTNGRGLVWQFASGELSGKKSNWSGLSGNYVDLSSKVTGGLFADSLLCYTSDYKGLGTATFPAVIAGSQRIAQLLESSAASSKGLYRAYGTITPAGHGSTVGYFPNAGGEFYVESCVGRGASGASDVGEGALYPIYVNAKGLCQPSADSALCSWIEGSPESVLETSWAFWRFRGGDQSAFEQDVANFYRQFYGYELDASDLGIIEAGAAN